LKALNRVKSVRHPYILSMDRIEIIEGQLMIVMELADMKLWDRFREWRAQGHVGIPRDELMRYMRAFYPTWDEAYAHDLRRQFALDHPGGNDLFSLDHVQATSGPHAQYGALARDGVSCAVCHRMLPKPQPADGTLGRGLHLFMVNCAGCHQIAGQGGYVTGAVAPPLESATSTQIAEAVRIGPYVMPRFSRQQLSDADLDSLIAYVQYAKHPDDRGGWAIGHIGPVPEGLVTWFIAAAALVAVCIVLGKRLRREAG
jgi:mono/diheme cytochrome c family protein